MYYLICSGFPCTEPGSGSSRDSLFGASKRKGIPAFRPPNYPKVILSMHRFESALWTLVLTTDHYLPKWRELARNPLVRRAHDAVHAKTTRNVLWRVRIGHGKDIMQRTDQARIAMSHGGELSKEEEGDRLAPERVAGERAWSCRRRTTISRCVQRELRLKTVSNYWFDVFTHHTNLVLHMLRPSAAAEQEPLRLQLHQQQQQHSFNQHST